MGLKQYWLRFGSGNPADNSGLAPTFTTFTNSLGQTLAPPAISEPLVGSGLYLFEYHATQSVAFVADGNTSGLSDANRYIVGSMDSDDQLTDLLGTASSSLGTDSVDPSTVFGFLKRCQANLEGDTIYSKGSGTYSQYTRGQTQLLVSKQITDSAAQVTKS